jgi:helicase, uvrD/REP family
MKLSNDAQSALKSEYPVLVLGGPGSGKTTLSLLKAKTYASELSDGQAVLFLSFSRAAVRQVEIRCHDLLDTQERRSIEVRTYHSFALDVIQTHGRLLSGEPPRIISPNKEALLKSRFSGHWASELKRMASGEGRYAFSEFATVANQLISGSNAVAELIADTYPVIILDEFQDTDDSQWELVKTLSQRSHMMFLADPDQRIFEYDEHVIAERLQHLRDYLRPAEFDLGGDNHRSPNSGILSYANALLHNTPLPSVPEVVVAPYYPKSFDMTMHAAVVWMFSNLRREGIERPSVAVFARTNLMVASVSDYLTQEHVYNGRTLKPVAHDVLWDAALTITGSLVVASILEWTALPRNAALMQTFELLAEYFDVKSALKPGSVKYAKEMSEKLSVDMFRLGHDDALKYKLSKHFSRAYETMQAFGGNPGDDWLRVRKLFNTSTGNLDKLYNDVKFVRLFRASDQIGECLSGLWDKQASYLGASSVLRRPLEMQSLQADYREPHGCSLMTVHKAKGKEFDGVVIVDGDSRSSSAFIRPNASVSERDSARRLLRVAITRARRRVVLLRASAALDLVDSD